MTFETGFANLQALKESHKDDESKRNEATTRLHLIDSILFDCLGWDRENCVAEEPHGTTFTDYALFAPYRALVVEAKKQGTYFSVPAGDDRLVRDISFFQKHNEGVFDAIKQAIGYCQSRGTRFGAVCNGDQLIAFIGSRTDGLPPMEGKALVFSSLEVMEREFLTLWNCLSKPGVLSNHLAIKLSEPSQVHLPEKLSRQIVNYPGFKNRNDMQTNLKILGDLLIEDVSKAGVNEEDFLRQCYAESGALTQYALVSKAILETRYSALVEKATGGPSFAPLVTKKGVNREAISESASRRPIILLGDVGVGKTMFIKHFIRITGSDVLDKALVFYLDFGTKPTLQGDMAMFIAEEIKSQLRDKHGVDIDERQFVRGVYHGELSRFAKGIYGDLKQTDPGLFNLKEIEFLETKLANDDYHIRASLEHIVHGRQKQVVIFLDNVDQRPHEFQQEVFLVAQSMAESWPSTVFLTLRPETFYKSRKTGTLSAYHAKAFTVAPPRLDLVIEKRLSYALALLDRGELSALPGVSLQLSSLRDYIQVLLESFRYRHELIEFGVNMCGGNVRLALDFIRTFIGSGHVDTAKILEIQRTNPPYYVPLHEFLRAVIFGDHEHYDPRASEVLNVFDILQPRGMEHFLLLILIGLIERLGQAGSDQGFVSVESVYGAAQGLGFQIDEIRFALERALNKKLLEVDARAPESEKAMVDASHYRITTVGAYYLKRLTSQFPYVDAVTIDTPILDPGYRAEIRIVNGILERLDRAEIFCDYLDSQWKAATFNAPPLDWEGTSKRLRDEIQRIRDINLRNRAQHQDRGRTGRTT